ncbi:NAD(P)/FAD-dependent oxidoreductase [Vallitalea okinawensis]|uniref:NAD(P)/FAD-dependent oxidoreductase n=1 Tax=Vallitalea okinawensis TaxID=2078660 RepID=UPI000CFD47D2|nr:NAD(P)/FAD-dependent oxidoreductase [Vallitalea okinawensis]
MADKKRIVILGAGYGGVLTAKKLARKFKKSQSVEIILIDKNPYHVMLTELHEVAANRVPENAIRIDLHKIFAERQVKVIQDLVIHIDFQHQVLQSRTTHYNFDYLVLGTGCQPTYYGIQGAKEHALSLWSYEDAVYIKEHILNKVRQAKKETDPIKKQKLLTFVVVGAGFTGIEMIGELGEWQYHLMKDFNLDEQAIKLYVVDAMPKILPNFPDKLVKKVEHRLVKQNVEVITGQGITEVTPDYVNLGEKGKIHTNTVIWAAGVEGSELLSQVDIEQQGRHRVVTNEFLQAKAYDNVFVVGDNIFFIPEGEERPVPQMVENAEHSSALVAANLIAVMDNKDKKSYQPRFHGSMVSVGGRYGVAHIGTPGHFFMISGFLALFIKHFINLVYFFQVAGFNKCWTYLMHEIFQVADRRSLTGGYFSKASPNFWLVPLRVFVGYKWLIQGWHKLPSILENPTKIFLIPPPYTDGTSAATSLPQTTDAVGAATGAAESAAAALEALPVPDFIEVIVHWSMDVFFYTSDGGYTFLATIFQAGMVIAEIVIGLLLILGLFTAIANIVAIAMGMMVWLSGMASMEMLWYYAGNIALIGGSGSSFGLDYYILPFLKKRWKAIKIVRKSYLYTDD